MSKFSELTSSNKPVLVDFFAEWCGPCKTMLPILQDVKAELKEEVSIIKINVDKNQRLASNYNIRSIPTLILFKQGAIKWKQSGIVDTSTLIHVIKRHL
ncbi:thioredoxin [Winogradskyella sp.]|uniref:thioredoxin n=1 Tax=Winogradskyella sp. TaxID=1883156 RepID=UPI00261FF789|nr:thioredoxin [Winogradskyella sp.]